MGRTKATEDYEIGEEILFSKFAFENRSGGTGLSDWNHNEKFAGKAVGRVVRKVLDHENGGTLHVEPLTVELGRYLERNGRKAVAMVSPFDATALTRDQATAEIAALDKPGKVFMTEILGEGLDRQGDMTVVLCAMGNPDRGQDPMRPLYGVPRSTPGVRSLAEASAKCSEFIAEHDLGGGNWTGGEVWERNPAGDTKLIARISYNGRVWKADPKPEVAPVAAPKRRQRREREQGPSR
jgi:hypothetical protein